MSLFRFAIAAVGLAGTATPAVAAVTIRIDGQFLQGSDALRQATGDATLSPHFTAGLAITMDVGLRGREGVFGKADRISRDANGRISEITPFWGWHTNQWDALASTVGFVWDHDRAHDDPEYPAWIRQTGNRIVFLFDPGTVPDRLAFDLDAIVDQRRTNAFQSIARVGTVGFDPVDYESFVTPTAPSRMQNGRIACTTAQGAETRESSTYPSFRQESFTSTVSARCGVSIDVKAFLPVAPPPADPVATAVPEPASWAMMIAGFALVGGSVRRRPSACPLDRSFRR